MPTFPPAAIVPRGGSTLFPCVRPRIVVRARVARALRRCVYNAERENVRGVCNAKARGFLFRENDRLYSESEIGSKSRTEMIWVSMGIELSLPSIPESMS